MAGIGTSTLNTAAIQAATVNLQTALETNDQRLLTDTLSELAASGALGQDVFSLPGGDNISEIIGRQLAAGRARIKKKEIGQIITRLTQGVSVYELAQKKFAAASLTLTAAQTTRGSGVLTRPSKAKPFVRRDYQDTIAKDAVEHFIDNRKKRGIYRLDTGEGKTPTNGFILEDLRKADPSQYKNRLTIIQTNRNNTAKKTAETYERLFPHDKIVLLTKNTTAEDLDGASIVVSTYSRANQLKSSTLLQEWVGERSALFIADEVDLMVYKGDKPDGQRTPTWIQLMVDFGIFNKSESQGTFRFDGRTRHRMLGTSATLDRPDGIPLSAFWGPGNIFYHAPMADGVKRGTSVPVVGFVQQMELPKGHEFAIRGNFTRIEERTDASGNTTLVPVLDQSRVQEAADSDYGIRTAVRSMLGHMLVKVGRGRNDVAVRQGIGYASDARSLEKHIRWQRDLFNLLETIYLVSGELENSRPNAKAIINLLGGRSALGQGEIPEHLDLESFDEGILMNSLGLLGSDLFRFLYSSEWQEVVLPLYKEAMSELRNKNRIGTLPKTKALFSALYKILNVKVREKAGRPLVASGVWDKMRTNPDGKGVVKKGSPASAYRNHFGDFDKTMKAFDDAKIDVLWNINIFDRGWDHQMVSLIVDNAPSGSRRMVVQHLGRIMRPEDPENPKVRKLKPDAHYVTITPNLEAYELDLDRVTLFDLFGVQSHADLHMLRVNQETLETDLWAETEDPVQLDLGSETRVNIILVALKTRNAFRAFLKQRNLGMGRKAELDPEILSEELFYDEDLDLRKKEGRYLANMTGDRVHNLLHGIETPRDQEELAWLLNAWGADQKTTNKIRAIYISDMANAKQIYGPSFSGRTGFTTATRARP